MNILKATFLAALSCTPLALEALPNDKIETAQELPEFRINRVRATIFGADSEQYPVTEANGQLNIRDFPNTVWYRWDAPIAGTMRVIIGAPLTVLFGETYAGTSADDLVFAGEDNLTANGINTYQYDVTPGLTYFTAIKDTFQTADSDRVGTFVFLQNFTPDDISDNFATRTQLAGRDFTIYGVNIGYGIEPFEPIHPPLTAIPSNASAWMTWSTVQRSTVTLKIDSPTVNFALSVYTGDQLATLTKVASTVATPQFTQTTRRSEGTLTFVAEPNTAYSFAVDGTEGRVGLFNLSLLAVDAAPGFSIQPESQFAETGNPAIFAATTSSANPTTFRWQRRVNGQWENLREITPYSGVTTNTLVVAETNLAMDGDAFRLQLTDENGTSSSRVVTLTVTEFAIQQQEVLGTVNLDISEGIVNGDTYYARGLPAGLRIDPQTGVISGVITGQPGVYPVTYWATLNGVRTRSYVVVFRVAPFSPALVGGFEALLTSGTPALPKFLMRLTVTPRGQFTGRLFTVGQPREYAFRGGLTLDQTARTASATVAINRGRNETPLTLSFTMDEEDSTFTASLNDSPSTVLASTTAGVALARFNALQLAPWAGRYTLALSAQSTFTPVPNPLGSGFAATTIAPESGLITLRGRLPDNTPITFSAPSAQNGSYRIARNLYQGIGNGGYLAGAFTVIPQTIGFGYEVPVAPANTLYWVKPERTRAQAFPDGFGPLSLAVRMSPWTPPVRDIAARLGLDPTGEMFVDILSPTIDNGEGNPRGLPVEVSIDTSNRIRRVSTLDSPLTINVNNDTGVFTGTFLVEDVIEGRPNPARRTLSVYGVMLQRTEPSPRGTPLGYGYFVIPPLPGSTAKTTTGQINFISNSPGAQPPGEP